MYSLSQYVEILGIGVSVLRNQETSMIKMLFIRLIFPECVVPLKNGKGVSESLWKCCDFLVRKGERTLSKKPRISSHWILLPTSATRTSQAHLRRMMGFSLWARVFAKQQYNMCWHTGSETYLSLCNWAGKTTKNWVYGLPFLIMVSLSWLTTRLYRQTLRYWIFWLKWRL